MEQWAKLGLDGNVLCVFFFLKQPISMLTVMLSFSLTFHHKMTKTAQKDPLLRLPSPVLAQGSED